MPHHLTPISSNILHTLFFQNWYAWTWQAIDYSIGSKKVGNESFSPKSAQSRVAHLSESTSGKLSPGSELRVQYTDSFGFSQ